MVRVRTVRKWLAGAEWGRKSGRRTGRAEAKQEAYNGNSNHGGSPFGDCGIGRKKNDTGQKERKVSPVRLRLRKVRGLRA